MANVITQTSDVRIEKKNHGIFVVHGNFRKPDSHPLVQSDLLKKIAIMKEAKKAGPKG